MADVDTGNDRKAGDDVVADADDTATDGDEDDEDGCCSNGNGTRGVAAAEPLSGPVELLLDR